LHIKKISCKKSADKKTSIDAAITPGRKTTVLALKKTGHEQNILSGARGSTWHAN
jgi:hypothetical protein